MDLARLHNIIIMDMTGLLDLIDYSTQIPDFIIQNICNDLGLDVNSKFVTDTVNAINESLINNNQTNNVYAHQISNNNDSQKQVNNQQNYLVALIFSLLKGKKHIKEKKNSWFTRLHSKLDIYR